ncbi:ketopantoate reductase PanE/ApbA C terminal-domain-containing protein [Chaetomium strumarium]|uniref:2-dehydropantoate 2-reductase n=1 Tax=Chaetomium strumarium TaxID=1170767 RepID=A0AAJ0GXT4_9PEZI|nr:ketopantoate reductase PanE/ApbA C terminal-domain-containing protein [Chaetomium strumarium]
MHGQKLHISILGVGNLGQYIAYNLLAGAPRRLRVTLLFHRESLNWEWKQSGQTIQCRMVGEHEFRLPLLDGFKVDNITTPRPQAPPTIKYLIVATKAPATAAAVAAIKHRLSRDSQILFVHNGLGVIDEVTDKVFPDAKTRPYYWAGVCEAGIHGAGPFQIIQAGKGPLLFGRSGARSCERADDSHPMSNDMSFARRLLWTRRALDARLLNSDQLVRKQLQKLVVNSVINPLTALYRCRNGDVFTRKEGQQLFDALVEEAGPVVRALLGISDGHGRLGNSDFSDDGLRRHVNRIATLTAGNRSSMLQDIEARRKTEIDYINGYLVRQAKKLGLPCAHHERIVQQIKELEEGGGVTDGGGFAGGSRQLA